MTARQQPLIGAIEGGGTKFVCAVGHSATAMRERAVIATRDPDSTLAECLQFLRAASQRHGPLAALGVASFGPLQLRTDASDHGCLLDTPKAGWSRVNLLDPFRTAFGVPLALDTDVAAAACGELQHGAGTGAGSLVYVTVGTGIGGALAPRPRDTRLLHEEMGHLAVRRDPRDAGFAGICPFHGDCLEGLASGPAIRARWGQEISQLPADHPGRDIIAGYLAQLAATVALLHAPERLVFGGGVMGDATLLPRIRQLTRAALGNYLVPLRDAAAFEAFIVPPALGGDSAIVGAATMAQQLITPKGEAR